MIMVSWTARVPRALETLVPDGAFCEGYVPKLKLERSQTIMGGASHRDFK